MGYNGHPNASNAFQYIYLPDNMKNRQDLLQPWEMRISLIYKPPSTCLDGMKCSGLLTGKPPPPGAHIWGPKRGSGWSPVGITVDEDTLPHILTFTNCDYHNACLTDHPEGSELRKILTDDSSRFLALPWSHNKA